ncbi:MAG: glycosyltransferase family 4 protein [SAR324 cluster bacterium]|nr:glycosyltransferase family 4 protein [SAR324 cluster bacterium]
MNVLLSSCVHWWNAEAAYAAVLAEQLLAAGHRVTVWTQAGTHNARELERRGLPIETSIPVPGGNLLGWRSTLAGLAALQARQGTEIVNVFRSAEFPFHLWAARHERGPRVVRTRGTARPIRSGWLNRKMHRDWCGGLIASSEAVRRQMGSALDLPEERIRTIYYPIDLPDPGQLTRCETARLDFLEELGIRDSRLLLGIVGRLYPEKGHARLLAALEKIVPAFPNVLLLILAKSAPGEDPERPALEKQVRELGLENHVRFIGFREDIRQLMSWFDIGVIPSLDSEVNCRVAVELFSVGTPVVAFPTGALPEVVEHELSGLVTATHSEEDLSEALMRLGADADLRKRLGQGARVQAERRFSPKGFLEDTLQVFEAALQGTP